MLLFAERISTENPNPLWSGRTRTSIHHEQSVGVGGGASSLDGSQQHHKSLQADPIIQMLATEKKKILLYYYAFKMFRLTQIYAKLL